MAGERVVDGLLDAHGAAHVLEPVPPAAIEALKEKW
jgi:hypothetical protein